MKNIFKIFRPDPITIAPKLWTNCDIPAKLFFRCVANSDYSLMGEGTPEQQEEAFNTIFDEYYTLEKNSKLESAYKKNNRINILQSQISFIESVLKIITFTPMTADERVLFIEELNQLEGVRVRFSLDKPIHDEILRVKTKVIGALKNELHAETTTEQKHKEGASITFERELARICISLGFYLSDDVSLRQYIEYRKEAIERNKPLPKKPKK